MSNRNRHPKTKNRFKKHVGLEKGKAVVQFAPRHITGRHGKRTYSHRGMQRLT